MQFKVRGDRFRIFFYSGRPDVLISLRSESSEVPSLSPTPFAHLYKKSK
jgi:hypothetical protein